MGKNQSKLSNHSQSASESSTSIGSVDLTTARRLAGNPKVHRPDGQSFFAGMPAFPTEEIFSYLGVRDRIAFFDALTIPKDDGHVAARVGVKRQQWLLIARQLSRYILDADLNKARALLERFKSDPALLRFVFNENLELKEKSGITKGGTPLFKAFSCYDWAMCEGGRDGMVEMLMNVMRTLPEGEQLIANQMSVIFPGGYQAHIDGQVAQAEEFANEVLELLANSIKSASDDEVRLVFGLTEMVNEKVDAYIAEKLINTPLWQALMEHRASIKSYMQATSLYNPYLLQQAIAICVAKDEQENWEHGLTEGYKRLSILSIHAIGGTQAFSPLLVQMLFANGGLWDFYEMSDDQRKNFEPARVGNFKYGGGRASAVCAGLVLVGLKYWACGDGGLWVRLVGAGCAVAVVVWVFCVKQKHDPWKSYSPMLNRTDPDSDCKSIVGNRG